MRICRKMPFHHYDHTHLLPHHLELYCQVLYTLYFALPCAQYTHTHLKYILGTHTHTRARAHTHTRRATPPA